MSVWRHCSSCRKDIEFSTPYWVCSVSTCARVAKTGLFFCSVGCWEAHLPTMRHREAWAVEERSPTEAQWKDTQRQAQAEASRSQSSSQSRPQSSSAPERRQVIAPKTSRNSIGSGPSRASKSVDREVLIVVSKLKKYIKESSGMNTSDTVMPVLSEHLRRLCDLAVDHAAEDGRKTVMDRDVSAILRG